MLKLVLLHYVVYSQGPLHFVNIVCSCPALPLCFTHILVSVATYVINLAVDLENVTFPADCTSVLPK
jgi:hypothetical protein